jgi:NAD(P)-dependent dehydrogenase (short-subunit alcohol dehydrogenase family)
MSTVEASALLRPGLLEGVSIVLAGAAPAASASASADAGATAAGLGAAVERACALLGARVVWCPLVGEGSRGLEQPAIEHAADAALNACAGAGAVDVLAVDAASLFTGPAAPHDRRHALQACLDASWNVTRGVAERAFLPPARGGRIVYLAPARGDGEHAAAARAGLENLARTLSIEWARHRITAVTIAPGAAGTATAQQVAAVTAYLASPAGAYFSGCVLDLSGTGAG